MQTPGACRRTRSEQRNWHVHPGLVAPPGARGPVGVLDRARRLYLGRAPGRVVREVSQTGARPAQPHQDGVRMQHEAAQRSHATVWDPGQPGGGAGGRRLAGSSLSGSQAGLPCLPQAPSCVAHQGPGDGSSL